MSEEKKYFIHPAVGIARVGDSPREFYIAPESAGKFEHPVEAYCMDKESYSAELSDAESDKLEDRLENAILSLFTDVEQKQPVNQEQYRDASGNVKRQVPRFRIYEYTYKNGEFDADNNRNIPDSIREITSDIADITWHVQVANLKSIVPETKGKLAGVSEFRYANQSELIDIAGNNKGRDITSAITVINAFYKDARKTEIPEDVKHAETFITPLKLGTLLTDEKGRLLFLGGRGRTFSTIGKETTVTDGDTRLSGWFDDTSDGVISATITLYEDERKSKEIGVFSEGDIYDAWVVCGMPKFSGPILPLISMYDRAENCVYGKSRVNDANVGLLYNSYIYPILANLKRMEYASQVIRSTHGHVTDNMISGITNSKAIVAVLKQYETIFGTKEKAKEGNMPLLYGDEQDRRADSRFISFTNRQIEYFKAWEKEGNPSHIGSPGSHHSQPVFTNFASVKNAPDPRDLDRAHMETIVGGGFNPGVEVNRTIAFTDPRTREEVLVEGMDGIKREMDGFEPYKDLGIAAGYYPTDIWQSPKSGPETYFYRINYDKNDIAGLTPGFMTYNLSVPWQIDVKECTEQWWPSAVPTSVWRNQSEVNDYSEFMGENEDISDHFDLLSNWQKLGYLKNKPDVIDHTSLAEAAPDMVLDEIIKK